MNPSIQTAQVLPARAVLFLGIVAIHVLLAYAFASGLIATTIHVLLPSDFEVIRLPDPPKRDDPPQTPTTTPTLYQTDTVPLPDLSDLSIDPGPGTITLPPEPAAPAHFAAAPASAPLPIRLVGRNVMPNTADYYPANEIRLGNEGTAEVQSCVDVNGKLDGTPTIEATSGREPLDRAAVRLARDGKYARAVRGDTPVPNCYRFRVTFTLH